MKYFIEDKLYNNIQEYCVYNNLDVCDYINDCIVKQFNIDRYGDLNTIIGNETNKKFIVSDIDFDKSNNNIVIKHNLGEDILIPINNIQKTNINSNEETDIISKEEDNDTKYQEESEVNNDILEKSPIFEEENVKKEIEVIKKKKRTLRTR